MQKTSARDARGDRAKDGQDGAVGRIGAAAVGLPIEELRVAGPEGGAAVGAPRFEIHAVDHADFVAVLQIAADAGQRNTHRNAVPRERLGRSNAGEHQ